MQNVYSSAVLAGLHLFALKFSIFSNFYWTRSSYINHSRQRKTRDTGLLDDENRIPLCFLILTQNRSVTDGRTDKQTDGQILDLRGSHS